MIIDSISEDKNTIQIGEHTFQFIEDKTLHTSCINCDFETTDDCSDIPCSPKRRNYIDNKNGHFKLLTK